MPDSDVQVVSQEVADNQTQTPDSQTAAQDSQTQSSPTPDPRVTRLEQTVAQATQTNKQLLDKLFETSIATLPPDQQAIQRANYERKKLESQRAEEEVALNEQAKIATSIIIANKYGIEPKDLMDMDSPEFMEQKAQLLKEKKALSAGNQQSTASKPDLTNPPGGGAGTVIDLDQYRNSGDVEGWLRAKRAVGEYS